MRIKMRRANGGPYTGQSIRGGDLIPNNPHIPANPIPFNPNPIMILDDQIIDAFEDDGVGLLTDIIRHYFGNMAGITEEIINWVANDFETFFIDFYDDVIQGNITVQNYEFLNQQMLHNIEETILQRIAEE